MTTPVPNYFGYTMVRKAGRDRAAELRTGKEYLPLPTGACTIMVSYDGPQKAELCLESVTPRRVMASATAGKNGVIKFGAKPGDQVALYIQPTPSESDVAQDYRATIEIISAPPASS